MRHKDFLRILVADPYPFQLGYGYATTVARMLRALHHQVWEALSLEAAYRAFQEEKEFDLVVLESCFPDGGGLSLVETAKQESPHTLRVVFSADELSAREVDSFFLAGAHAVVCKEGNGLMELDSILEELCETGFSSFRAGRQAA